MENNITAKIGAHWVSLCPIVDLAALNHCYLGKRERRVDLTKEFKYAVSKLTKLKYRVGWLTSFRHGLNNKQQLNSFTFDTSPRKHGVSLNESKNFEFV